MKSMHLTRLITISVLLLAAATRGWSDPGDIDVNFGSSGLASSFDVTLVLPDDRLVSVLGARVARFDANGEVDATFGDGGVALIPLPDATPFFDASSAAATPDGGLLVAGILSDGLGSKAFEAVLRLDHDGRLVTPFGGRGDGLYRPPVIPGPPGMLKGVLVDMAVDPVGRVLLTERSWTNGGWFCDGADMVVRLTPGGAPDTTFGENGRAMLGLCVGRKLFGVRNDGSIVLGGRGAIVGLDATGALDTAFGVSGRVSHGLPNEWERGRLLPDGGIMIVGRDSSATSSHIVFTKIGRNGQPDAAYGPGTGSVQLDLGAAFFGNSGSRQSVHDFVLTPDGAHVYLQVTVLRADGTAACAGGIARFHLDGTPDTSFGRQGLTCLDYGAFPFALLASQRDGSPLFGGWYSGLNRLLVDATASPGMLTMVRNGPVVHAREADGTVAVPVMRTAGRDGTVSLRYSTGQRRELGYNDDIVDRLTTQGSDYQAASGRLDWADGDEGERAVTVTILDDEAVETEEFFSIELSDPQGGALGPPYYEASFVNVAIADDDGAVRSTIPPPIDPPSTADNGGGGGGSMSLATLLILAGLFLGASGCSARVSAQAAATSNLADAKFSNSRPSGSQGQGNSSECSGGRGGRS